jgi:primosomal protein N' (replication factor Y)
VALPRPVWQTYVYRLSGSPRAGRGCRIVVPFGRQTLVGFLWGDHPGAAPAGLRDVLEVIDDSPLLPGTVLRLVRWSADYYMAPPGMMLAAAMPPGSCGPAAKKKGRWRPAAAVSPRTVRYLRPAEGVDDLTVLADRIRARAPRQAEILFALSVARPPVPTREILARAGASRRSLAALIDRGLVAEEERRAFREPDLSMDAPVDGRPPDLTPDQESVLKELRGGLNGTERFLLHGVTGSGKTEVYLRLIGDVVDGGGSALVLVPEISLTPLAVSRFEARFPGQVAVLHSGMAAGERWDSWELARRGKRRIVIGPRSAVFAPLPDLGLIVVDEEHDGSYKQGEQPHYSARDLAVVRAGMEGCPAVLGSASPSMESYGNAKAGKYRLLELPSRVDGRPMPRGEIVTAAGLGSRLLSNRLLAGIGIRASRGEQAIVLVNRRGFSPTQICRNCGRRPECPHCAITLTYHRKGEALRCHHCGYWTPALARCPECGCTGFSHMGPGVQRVEEELCELLPGLRVIRMDADTTTGRGSHWEILSRFGRGEGDVLLGTQMVAKGHDFPGVTLVGIVAADQGLAFPDFRASERVFALILQAAGRAGRGRSPGEVVVQALDPEDPVIVAAAAHDYAGFWKMESAARRELGYPPFGRLVRFVWSGRDLPTVRRAARVSWARPPDDLRTLAPSPAVLEKVSDRHRLSALAMADSVPPLRRLAAAVRRRFEQASASGVRLDVDVDPLDML